MKKKTTSNFNPADFGIPPEMVQHDIGEFTKGWDIERAEKMTLTEARKIDANRTRAMQIQMVIKVPEEQTPQEVMRAAMKIGLHVSKDVARELTISLIAHEKVKAAARKASKTSKARKELATIEASDEQAVSDPGAVKAAAALLEQFAK